MKAFALVRMSGGIPDLPEQVQGLVNYVLCEKILDSGWGAYLIAAELAILKSLDEQWNGFVGIVAVTEDGDVHWGELNNPCPEAIRTKINAWLSARGLPTIPESWTNRQVIKAIYQWASGLFDFNVFNVKDWEEI